MYYIYIIKQTVIQDKMKPTQKQIAEVTAEAIKANVPVYKCIRAFNYTSAAMYKTIKASGLVDAILGSMCDYHMTQLGNCTRSSQLPSSMR